MGQIMGRLRCCNALFGWAFRGVQAQCPECGRVLSPEMPIRTIPFDQYASSKQDKASALRQHENEMQKFK